MKKRKICNLNLNLVRVASLSKMNILTGGDGDDGGQTNGKTKSYVIKECPVVVSGKKCFTDNC